MSQFKPELIIFDLDGTLVDSSPDIATAINKMLAEVKQDTHSEQQIKQWMGSGAKMLIKRALTGELEPQTEPENLDQAMALFFDFYARHICVQSQLYEGVLEGLAQLKSAHIQLACITNKPSQFTLPLLSEIGLKGFFPFIASGDTYAQMKPDPLPLLEALKTSGIQAEQALMVGDSISDIQAGKRANIKTALVPYGYMGQYTADELDADYQITRIDQLLDLFYQ